MTRVPVLLDCDPGIDDALALAYLVAEHHAGAAELTGVVCTAGNAPLDETVRNALAWLDLAAAPELPVSAGSGRPLARPHPFTPETHGPDGAGHAILPSSERRPDARSGAHLWVDIARARPGEVTGVVTGPSSTLAHALRIEPRLPSLLRRLVVMGGSFSGHPGNTTPVSEWNVDFDPEAADAVCRAWDARLAEDPAVPPVTWCGLNLTEQAVWTPRRSDALLRATAGTAAAPLARHLVDALRFYFEFHDSVGEGYSAQVHDPAVAWLALRPREDTLTAFPAHLRVECDGGLTRGMTVADVRGHRGLPANARIATALRGPGGFDAVLDDVAAAIAKPAARSGESFSGEPVDTRGSRSS